MFKIIKFIILRLFLVFSIIIFIYSFYKIIVWFKDNNNTINNVKIIYQIADEKIDEDNTVNVDFNDLLLKNNDVIGWIKVNNTNIDYPVVKGDNNNYYLTHSFDKSYNDAGWIFMDYRNNYDILDNNTIIYGHGRKDGSMFGSLNKVLDSSWYLNKDNYEIMFTTLNNKYKFRVFSIYTINSSDYIDINYNNELLDTIISRSIYDFNVDVNINDRILTLSTCFNNELKAVVHAKMI